MNPTPGIVPSHTAPGLASATHKIKHNVEHNIWNQTLNDPDASVLVAMSCPALLEHLLSMVAAKSQPSYEGTHSVRKWAFSQHLYELAWRSLLQPIRRLQTGQ